MLGVEDYGSDVESGDERAPSPPPTKPQSSLLSKLPPPSKKSSLALPPPSSSGVSSTKSSPNGSGLSLPPPKAKKPKKIAIGLPSLPDEGTFDDIDNRPAKKPRLGSGAGSSGLLSMLPAPKNKAPTPATPERVLGGGRGPGLVFNIGHNRPPQKATVEDAEDDEHEHESTNVPPLGTSILEEVKVAKPSIPFLPPSLAKGKANVSTEEKFALPKTLPKPSPAPAVDFFSLGSSSPSTSSLKPSGPPSIPSLSSAPQVDDFVPPEPTPQDPYPGYYLLPTGSWATHDPSYYQKFYNKWKKEYDSHVRALEKGIEKGFEAVEKEGAQEVDAAKEMEKAREQVQVREERKALTSGAGAGAAAPRMNIKGAALGGRARSRHQLTSLLTEAYQNREALEEQIAQGRRNRKEAGNKYGF